MNKKHGFSIGTLLLTLLFFFVVALALQISVNDFAKSAAEGWNSVGEVGDPSKIAFVFKTIVWLIFIVVIGVIIYLRIVRPVRKISKSMERVKEGNLDEQIRNLDGMEFGLIEDNFNSMVESLKKARELEKDANEKNRKLYAEIAHDLKTPMTMILGYARIIKEGNLDEKTREQYLDTIIEQTGNANALLEEMLEYAKLGSAEYNLTKEESDIAELLRQVTADNYIRFEKKNMSLDADIPQEPVMYSFDVAQMKRVITNLLGNAVKHNHEGIDVKVILTDKRSSGGHIEILVSDNGPVISDELKEGLFEPFRTGDDSRKTGNGSGLGLSISRKIVTLHGGTLDYSETKVSGYKSFVIELK
ncbi:MAG: HAMP domain-containing histidine kinase [Clostridiales bacterium]|nr:HAMP domain-containing histidine kinase [Clostridiales bacterium]